MFYLNENRRKLLRDWLPVMACGLIAWGLFVFLGQTPVVRATAMAVAVIGIAATLRRMGALQSFAGGMLLALSPAFWSQTGGAASNPPTSIALALVALAGLGVFVIALSQRPYVIMALSLAIFAALFYAQFGITRSLRITVMASAWIIHLLFMAVLEANPRPEDASPARLRAQYRAGLLLLLGVGIINDPLFVLFTPAVALGLALSKTRIPLWYWGIMAVLFVLGVRGIYVEYYRPEWWVFPVDEALARGAKPPFLVAGGLRHPERWISLFGMIAQQFTVVGVALGLVGLSRLSRWYPVPGITMLIAWGAFFTFGLPYFGADRDILLMPLLMIQVIWMTYAVYVLGQWFERSLRLNAHSLLRYAAAALYLALPALLLFNIVRTV